MITLDEASDALESLLEAMEYEATTPSWYAIEDHTNGGHEEYHCTVAPFIHWLWYQESSMPSKYSRDNDLIRGGILASNFSSLTEENREHIFILLRYLSENRCSYKESLVDIEGDQGQRILSGLKISGWI